MFLNRIIFRCWILSSGYRISGPTIDYRDELYSGAGYYPVATRYPIQPWFIKTGTGLMERKLQVLKQRQTRKYPLSELYSEAGSGLTERKLQVSKHWQGGNVSARCVMRGRRIRYCMRGRRIRYCMRGRRIPYCMTQYSMFV